MTNLKHTWFDPHGSHQKMLHVHLTHLPRCALTFFPLPKGQPVRRLRAAPSMELKLDVYKHIYKEEGSQKKGVRIAAAGLSPCAYSFLPVVIFQLRFILSFFLCLYIVFMKFLDNAIEYNETRIVYKRRTTCIISKFFASFSSGVTWDIEESTIQIFPYSLLTEHGVSWNFHKR